MLNWSFSLHQALLYLHMMVTVAPAADLHLITSVTLFTFIQPGNVLSVHLVKDNTVAKTELPTDCDLLFHLCLVIQDDSDCSDGAPSFFLYMFTV